MHEIEKTVYKKGSTDGDAYYHVFQLHICVNYEGELFQNFWRRFGGCLIASYQLLMFTPFPAAFAKRGVHHGGT